LLMTDDRSIFCSCDVFLFFCCPPRQNTSVCVRSKNKTLPGQGENDYGSSDYSAD
jgi:hypothetical protein